MSIRCEECGHGLPDHPDWDYCEAITELGLPCSCGEFEAPDGYLRGRCIGCFHDFRTGPCGGCGAVPKPGEPLQAWGGKP